MASIGIAAAAILLAAMATLSWWTVRTQREQLHAWQSDRLRTVGTFLASNMELLLVEGDLSRVRRTIAETARAEGLSLCRLKLPPDRIIADAEPGNINLQHLPDKWTAPLDPVAEHVSDDGSVKQTLALTVPNRGAAVLEIAVPQVQLYAIPWETQAGIGGIGAVGLASLLLVYRRLRMRMRGIGAIREALESVSRGESSFAALAVHAEFGPEATAWNQLLQELETLKQQTHADRAKDTLASRRSGRNDLDVAFDAMPQGLLLVDEQLRVRYANGAAAVFLHAKREQLVDSEITKWIAQEEIVSSLKQFNAGTLRRKTSIEVAQSAGSGSAETVLRFTIRPVRRDDVASAMIMIEDITQQRVAAEARNSFVAQATHELRTPLTNIRLYVETAIEEGEEDPQVRGKCLNVINQEARRLERIVGEMLSVAEIEAGSLKIKRDDVRIDQLMDELKADFMQQAQEKKIELIFDLPPKVPVVQADRDKLAVALHNLVGNALKYTPDKGQVTVKLEVEKSQVLFSITDTGIGISDEDQGRIFERFYRAQDPRIEKITGTGLGLTLAREVVRLHGGDINVKSEINKGSTFTILLPAQLEAA